MRDKINFLLAIFFLMTLFSGISVSASYDWSMFGNSYQPLSQAQYSGESSIFNSTNVLDLNISSGQTQFNIPTQALVGNLRGRDTNYLVYASGNYLRIYTNGLTFLSEYYSTYTPLGQMSMVDWDGDSVYEIAGFFRENITDNHFQVLKLNLTSNSLYSIYDNDFVDFFNGTTGIRCGGNECYSVIYDNVTDYDWYDFRINQTGYTIHLLLLNNSYIPLEPPSRVDFNNDGIKDYLVFSEQKVLVYNELGVIIRDWDVYRGVLRNESIKGAKFFIPYGSSYWKVAVVYDVPTPQNNGCEGFNYSCGMLKVLNVIDGSVVFKATIIGTSTSGDNARIVGLTIGDYNNDYYSDIWVVGSRLTTTRIATLGIYKGDGTLLYANSSLGADVGAVYPNSQITLARMDNDTTYDVIIYDGKLRVFSPITSSYIYNSSGLVGGQGSCIPADLTFDGKLDIVCSTVSLTRIFHPNYINQNAIINTLTFSPSTSIPKQNYISVTISASDFEGDSILYINKCSNSDSWSAEDSNFVKSCYYASAGAYNLSVGVRDSYHSDFVYYSQDILVTETGTFCNNNGTCDLGETYSNCPNDCPSTPNITQASEIGGMPLPTKLVDIQNTEQGLLPEIYYGTLAFLSGTLTPMIVLIFFIFFVLIIFAIGFIIKKMAKKVGELAR